MTIPVDPSEPGAVRRWLMASTDEELMASCSQAGDDLDEALGLFAEHGDDQRRLLVGVYGRWFEVVWRECERRAAVQLRVPVLSGLSDDELEEEAALADATARLLIMRHEEATEAGDDRRVADLLGAMGIAEDRLVAFRAEHTRRRFAEVVEGLDLE